MHHRQEDKRHCQETWGDQAVISASGGHLSMDASSLAKGSANGIQGCATILYMTLDPLDNLGKLTFCYA
jgi:hypothetical protein